MRKHRYEHQGYSLTLKGWAGRLGVDYRILKRRLDDGWTVERTLSTRVHADELRWLKESLPDATGRRAVRRLEYGGKSLTVKEWSRRTGVPVPTMDRRIADGRPVEEVLGFKKVTIRYLTGTPPRLYTYGGESCTAREWAKRLHLSCASFYERVRKGLPDELLFKPHVRKSRKRKVRKVSKETRLRNFRKGLRFLPSAAGLR